MSIEQNGNKFNEERRRCRRGGGGLGVGLGEGVARYRHPISRGVRFRGAPIRRRASLLPLCKTEADANLCSPDLGPGFLRSGIAEGAFVRSGASAALVGLWVAGDPIPVDAGLTESGETLCQTGIDTNPYSFIIESSFPPPLNGCLGSPLPARRGLLRRWRAPCPAGLPGLCQSWPNSGRGGD